MAASPSDALVLFGVTGDLAHKMIFPALYAVVKRGDLNVPIVGVALPKWAGGIGHGAVLHEDKITVIHGNGFTLAVGLKTDAGHNKLAVLGLVIEIGHLATDEQVDALGFEPCLQRQDEGIVLVVDGSLHTRKSFNAGKFQHEAEQITLELDGAMPGLKGERSGPHVSLVDGSLAQRRLSARADAAAAAVFSSSIQ